ncbi:MAG: M20/M25/M40 family metallo-hydrolase [Myxococcales bacterium]|nr:M20/M25/M40 family metallo-hydrolase [Myxococcales bacterium]
MTTRSSFALLAVAASACGGTKPDVVVPAPAVAAEPAAPDAPDAPDSAAAPYSVFDRAAAAITPEFLREQIAKLGSDELEGRGPTTRGDVAARGYLASQLAAYGYEPGGQGGSWEQSFDLVGVTAAMPKTWAFARGGKKLSLAWWDQYIAGSGVQAERGSVKNAEVVFVGYGITAPEYGWDDFKGQDVRGKVLLMLNSDPDWDPALFAGSSRLYYGRWSYKYESAARAGAVGAIIIHTTPSAGYPFQVVQSSWTGEQFELPAAGAATVVVKGWVTESAAGQLVALAGKKLPELVEAARSKDFRPVPLGVTTSLAFTNKVHRAPTANVLGLLRGSDPKLRDEVVVVTAHHDHLGIGKPNAAGDSIYNGALDNGAGCAQVLAIAKALASLPARPRRSVQVVFVAAEEQGLLGSAYYAANPSFPPGAIAANVNFDGGNIWGKTKDVTYIGKGKSSLDGIVEEIATRQGRTVKPDQFPDRGFFYRSDQFNFAKIGVPALYLSTGTEFVGKPSGWGTEQLRHYETTNYHQPTDQLAADWTFEGMVEDATIGLWTAYQVAQRDEVPSWTPGDEFEAARKAALAARKAAASPR